MLHPRGGGEGGASLTGSPGTSERGLCGECRHGLESQVSRVLKTEARGAGAHCPSDENQGKFFGDRTMTGSSQIYYDFFSRVAGRGRS